MILNGRSLLQSAPIKNMQANKIREHGVSYGLSEAGYDIRIKEEIFFSGRQCAYDNEEIVMVDSVANNGSFTIASAIEEFDMPPDVVGLVKDKSTWARRGLSVFNTVIEPGWKGFLTLELVYHGQEELVIPAGAGIAQVIFQTTTDEMFYSGKYQNQSAGATEAKFE